MNAGSSISLKILEGGLNTVVGIICPLVEIGLTVWPKTGGGGYSPPTGDGPADDSFSTESITSIMFYN